MDSFTFISTTGLVSILDNEVVSIEDSRNSTLKNWLNVFYRQYKYIP